jgi:transposase-like protein
MLERGVSVSYESVRRRWGKFGQTYADALRRRQPRSEDKWHLDEVRCREWSSPTSSAATAHHEVMPSVEHRQWKYLNNQAGYTHSQPGSANGR